MTPIRPIEPIQASATITNPVFEGYFADPFVFRYGGIYYAVGTSGGPLADSSREFPMLRSNDFVQWEPLGGALIRSGEGGSHYWAPEIAELDGKFYMYYSVGTSDERHVLHVATSERPEGPYLECCEPVLDPTSSPFAIDPSPFQDDDGRWFLFYARNFLDADHSSRPGTALAVAPLIDMVRVPAEFTTVMRAHHNWQRFQANRPMYGGVYDWHTLEGPCCIKSKGRYYCLYSGGSWQNDSYGVDFVVADYIEGPWIDTNSGDGPRVLRTVPGQIIGPGHNSVVADPHGHPFVAYHAWNSDMTARRFCLDRLSLEDDGPRVIGYH